MIKEDLVAERIAIDSYREMINYFGNDDPTSRRCWKAFSRSKKETSADDLVSLAGEDGLAWFWDEHSAKA